MSVDNEKVLEELSALSIQALRRSQHDKAIAITQDIIDRQSDHAGAHAIQFSSLFKSKSKFCLHFK